MAGDVDSRIPTSLSCRWETEAQRGEGSHSGSCRCESKCQTKRRAVSVHHSALARGYLPASTHSLSTPSTLKLINQKARQPKFKGNHPQEWGLKYFFQPHPLTVATELGLHEKDISSRDFFFLFSKQTIPLEYSLQSARDRNGCSGPLWPSTNQVLCLILRDPDYYHMK